VAAPAATLVGRGRHVFHRNVVVYRHSWSIIFSGFFEPVFYLVAMGLGVGELVGDVVVDGVAVDYRDFVAPALLASSAMNGAVYESTMNIFHKLRYARTYDAMLATPLRVGDVAVGEIGWCVARCGLYSAGFLIVMLAFGLVPSWWAVLALPAALLIGFAFAAVGMAATTFMRSWSDFDAVVLIQMLLFLFSATFYPLSTYPEALQWVVRITPLYQGVDLMRALVLGTVSWDELGHVAYLVALGLLGVAVVRRRMAGLLLR
jgi:lipooligosaccharide transport system permease protein